MLMAARKVGLGVERGVASSVSGFQQVNDVRPYKVKKKDETERGWNDAPECIDDVSLVELTNSKGILTVLGGFASTTLPKVYLCESAFGL